MKTKITGCVVVAGTLLFGCVGKSQQADMKVPAEATVNGKYSNLLRTIKVPDDEILYGKFSDFRYYVGTEYAGYKDLVPGYWVYVAPNWYIWKDSKTPHEQVSTIDGPEARHIVGRINGYVVIASGSSEIVAVSLPAMRQTVVRPEETDGTDFYPTIHALSGPDSEGRIAYIEDHFFVQNEKDRKHLLKTIKLDGTADTKIFSRPGDAMWAENGEIGDYLALAPTGGKVAFISDVEGKQMPRALLSIGQIEIWDVGTKTPLVVNTKALDEAMSWFPDGERLAYVRLVPRNELPNPALGLDIFGKYAGELWDQVPAVYILHTRSGESTFLHVGWTPVVSLDGKTVLVGGWGDTYVNFTWMRVDMHNRQSKSVQWPGDAGGAIAAPSENIVLYWGSPTTGAPIKYITDNSRLYGAKLMLTLKATLIGSAEFQTVVPEIKVRSLVSFGQVLKKK